MIQTYAVTMVDAEETNRRIQEQFSRSGENYVKSRVHSNTNDLEFCISMIEPKSEWNVLDVATGTGHLGHTLAAHVQTVVGFDLTQKMLDIADREASKKGLTNFTVRQGDVHELPFGDSVFDLVTVRIAPHHFSDIKKAVAEMARVLRKGGRLFIEDTIAPSEKSQAELFNRIEWLRDTSHVRDLSFNEWKLLLEQSGLKVMRAEMKEKEWPLRWWTERMNTPEDNVEKVLDLLEDNHMDLNADLRIVRDESQEGLDRWTIYPNNGYFLAEKI